jgi:hypothetical protein
VIPKIQFDSEELKLLPPSPTDYSTERVSFTLLLYTPFSYGYTLIVVITKGKGLNLIVSDTSDS